MCFPDVLVCVFVFSGMLEYVLVSNSIPLATVLLRVALDLFVSFLLMC